MAKNFADGILKILQIDFYHRNFPIFFELPSKNFLKNPTSIENFLKNSTSIQKFLKKIHSIKKNFFESLFIVLASKNSEKNPIASHSINFADEFCRLVFQNFADEFCRSIFTQAKKPCAASTH